MRRHQTTDRVLLVEPTHFGWNAETAATNTFMQAPDAEPEAAIRAHAQDEFSRLRRALTDAGVCVEIGGIEDVPKTPDAVFPNNWFSTHESGELVLYPMAVPSRRAERRPQLIAQIERACGTRRVIDLSELERHGFYLEGTGSLILDRPNRVAYAGLSSRTHPEALQVFSQRLDYEVVSFPMADPKGREIYHTNVMMSLGTSLAILCPEAIPDETARHTVLDRLARSGREILPLSFTELHAFAANALELRAAPGQGQGEPRWALSQAAHDILPAEKRAIVARSGKLVVVPIPVIERIGGGSVRCMIGELFPSASAA